MGNTYNRVYIWCCKYGENRYCERCANKKVCASKHTGLLNSCLGKLCLHPYLVVPLISARVTLISTRVSAHCRAILLRLRLLIYWPIYASVDLNELMPSASLRTIRESMICVCVSSHQLTDTVYTESLLVHLMVYVIYALIPHLSQCRFIENVLNFKMASAKLFAWFRHRCVNQGHRAELSNGKWVMPNIIWNLEG